MTEQSQYIHRFGIEVEGGWNETPPGFKHDGSVDDYLANVCGEVASEPLRLDACEDFLQDRFPDATDRTCGLHVHFSPINVATYGRLMDDDFADMLIEASISMVEATPDVWPSHTIERLQSGNQYCNPDLTVTTRRRMMHEGRRYYHINYPFSTHGTVEVRMFPMPRCISGAVDAIYLINDVVDVFLETEDQVNHEIAVYM